MNNGVKIGIIVVALLAAVLLVVFRGTGGDEPASPQDASALWFKCSKCGHEFSVMPDQVDKLGSREEAPQESGDGDSGPRTRTAQRSVRFFECEKCKEIAAELIPK